MGWYDRKVRRVRDLSCGDTRIFLELEVRRVACRGCGKVKRERLDLPSTTRFVWKKFSKHHTSWKFSRALHFPDPAWAW
jgi:transposase